MPAPHPGFQQEQLSPDVRAAVEAALEATSAYIIDPALEQTAKMARANAIEALGLPQDQVYRYELMDDDQLYDRPSSHPRPLPADFIGQLVFAVDTEIMLRLEPPATEERNHFHAYPLVPHTSRAELRIQESKIENVGLAVALGLAAFRQGRLTIVSRGYAESLVPSGYVFNPGAAQINP